MRYENYPPFPDKWNERYMQLARVVSTWSKDPSTKVGAVIADSEYRLISVGYNGFPRGVEDDFRLEDRSQKYQIVVHAERNAMLFAARTLDGCRMFVWPMMTCSQCAAMIIQTRIVEVISVHADPTAALRWKTDIKTAEKMYNEVGIRVTYLEPGDKGEEKLWQE